MPVAMPKQNPLEFDVRPRYRGTTHEQDTRAQLDALGTWLHQHRPELKFPAETSEEYFALRNYILRDPKAAEAKAMLEEAIDINLGLAIKLCNSFHDNNQHLLAIKGIEKNDLLTIAVMGKPAKRKNKANLKDLQDFERSDQGLMSALLQYDSQVNAKFGTFATTMIERALGSYIREKPTHQAISFSAIQRNETGWMENAASQRGYQSEQAHNDEKPALDAASAMMLAHVVDEENLQLLPNEKNVLRTYFILYNALGEPPMDKDIANALGISRQAVHKTFARLLQKIGTPENLVGATSASTSADSWKR
jgi:DNA-directed RNA polymerase specialized sigma subunit